jgi:glutathione peroxidase
MEFVKQFNGADKKLTFFQKADVNGSGTREVFSFLKQKLPNDDNSTDIRWNFNIFLVDREGTPVKRYQPSGKPYEAMKPKIEELLAKTSSS